MQAQEAKLRLLARAAQIPESEIENITLDQEFTDSHGTGGDHPPSSGSSGSSGSTRYRQQTKTDPKAGKSARVRII